MSSSYSTVVSTIIPISLRPDVLEKSKVYTISLQDLGIRRYECESSNQFLYLINNSNLQWSLQKPSILLIIQITQFLIQINLA